MRWVGGGWVGGERKKQSTVNICMPHVESRKNSGALLVELEVNATVCVQKRYEGVDILAEAQVKRELKNWNVSISKAAD